MLSEQLDANLVRHLHGELTGNQGASTGDVRPLRPNPTINPYKSRQQHTNFTSADHSGGGGRQTGERSPTSELRNFARVNQTHLATQQLSSQQTQETSLHPHQKVVDSQVATLISSVALLMDKYSQLASEYDTEKRLFVEKANKYDKDQRFYQMMCNDQ